MKLMDLFKPYSGRLRAAEANAEVLLEIDDIKHEPAGVKWTSRKMILYPGAPLRTEQLRSTSSLSSPSSRHCPSLPSSPRITRMDLIPPRRRG